MNTRCSSNRRSTSIDSVFRVPLKSLRNNDSSRNLLNKSVLPRPPTSCVVGLEDTHASILRRISEEKFGPLKWKFGTFFGSRSRSKYNIQDDDNSPPPPLPPKSQCCLIPNDDMTAWRLKENVSVISGATSPSSGIHSMPNIPSEANSIELRRKDQQQTILQDSRNSNIDEFSASEDDDRHNFCFDSHISTPSVTDNIEYFCQGKNCLHRGTPPPPPPPRRNHSLKVVVENLSRKHRPSLSHSLESMNVNSLSTTPRLKPRKYNTNDSLILDSLSSTIEMDDGSYGDLFMVDKMPRSRLPIRIAHSQRTEPELQNNNVEISQEPSSYQFSRGIISTRFSSVSKKNKCTLISDPDNMSPPRSGHNDPGFSSKKRRSHFMEALKELEKAFNSISNDTDLLDRAERRDLPTVHQELIADARKHFTDRENLTPDFRNYTSDSDKSFWNISSSFEELSPSPSPLVTNRTPKCRRSAIIDKVKDDMAYRMAQTNNRIPRALEINNNSQSYLRLSPSGLTNNRIKELYGFETQPDPYTDDMSLRSVRDKNSSPGGGINQTQPKFGIPLKPVPKSTISDYLHAVPSGKYRSSFNPMRNPDLVLDDLAYRNFRKDSKQCHPDQLGIYKNPRVKNNSCWKHRMQDSGRMSPLVFYPNRQNRLMRSMSENIVRIIKKQSCQPSAGSLISLDDLSDPKMLQAISLTLGIIEDKINEKQNEDPLWQGKTIYELFTSNSSTESARQSKYESNNDSYLSNLRKTENCIPVPKTSSLNSSCTISSNSADSDDNFTSADDLESIHLKLNKVSDQIKVNFGTSNDEKGSTNDDNLPEVVRDAATASLHLYELAGASESDVSTPDPACNFAPCSGDSEQDELFKGRFPLYNSADNLVSSDFKTETPTDTLLL